MIDLSGLNPVQRRAVEHGEGALLLLAGAGSGKTRVVTHRIARLLEGGEHPDSIVALTFTNRAAREMRDRVAGLLGQDEVPGLTISTFHSLGARFLRRHAKAVGRGRDFTVYDDTDQLALLRRLLAERDVPDRAAVAKATRKAFDQAKNAGGGAADALPLEDLPFLDVAELGRAYDDALQASNAFDFGDLIVRPARLLAEDEFLRGEYRRRWRWVLVDEFQDTNAAQYLWLQQIAPPGSNLFVVGDDDQSIYGWRGAEVANILGFPTRYAGAEVLRLEQNYRSDRNILDAANSVIARNENRLGKDLWTEGDAGARLGYHEARDARDEAAWVVGQINALRREEGFALGDCAVLLRANHLSLDLEEVLARVGVSYLMVRGRAFYDRAEVRDAVAYLRLVVNPLDDVAFARAVGAPKRGVGAGTLAKLGGWASEQGMSLFTAAQPMLDAGLIKGSAKRGLRGFMELFETERATPEGFQALLEEAGLICPPAAVAGLDEDAAGRDANIRRLVGALSAFVDEVPDGGLGDFLEQIKLVSDADGVRKGEGAVSIMTIHAAKGLEFPVVFVMAMEEGVFPSGRGDDEEERRLCYVAITRAERRLYFTRARRRRTFGETRANAPSRFLAELPEGTVEARYVEPYEPSWRRRPRRQRARPVEVYADPPAASVDEHCQDVVYVEAVGSSYPVEGRVSDDLGGEGWRPGMPVYHAQFGVGRVQAVSRGNRTTLEIDFPDVGRRRIIADFVSPYEG